MKGVIPKLRFSEFDDAWSPVALGQVLDRVSVAVTVDSDETYREIGVRSHGRGVFHKNPILGADLGNKRVFHVVPDALVLNIVFAWEQAVAITSKNDKGYIASHRFPLFVTKEGKAHLPFIYRFLLTRRGKELLELASPGGAGRNKTLGQQEFLKLKAPMPTVAEQKKIASFLEVVDDKIVALQKKKSELEAFKSGLMQCLFSRELRFTREDGTAFPDWEEKALSEVLFEHRHKSAGNEPVFSVSVHRGLVNQVEHLGRSFSAASTNHYNRVLPGDIVYTKSPTGEFSMGIIKQSHVDHDVIVSPLYGVFTPATRALGFILHCYFESNINAANYLTPLVQKGAKNTIAVTNARFLGGKLTLPADADEQCKMAGALQALDAKIASVVDQTANIGAFKKGLMQGMFM